MKNLVILLLMLLPHLGVAANCKSFEIANEAIPPTMLDYTINNNAACNKSPSAKKLVIGKSNAILAHHGLQKHDQNHSYSQLNVVGILYDKH